MTEPVPLPRPEIVRARREKLQLSYEKLAERLSLLCGYDVKWQSIQQFEKGKSAHPKFLRELARALTTTDEFLAGRTTEPDSNDSFTPLIKTPDSPQRGQTGQEGGTVIMEVMRLIGRLEQRMDALEAKLNQQASDEHTAPARGPRRGTRGR